MALNTSKIAWAITLAAAAGGVWLLSRRNGGLPSLLDTKQYYPEYDMENYTNKDLLPRGYRNNNPLNIRISSNAWKGKVANNTDGTFEQFEDMVHGYRAALVLLRNNGYIRGGINTIRKIITKFAPPSENYTEDYIRFVSNTSGIDPDAVISRNDKNALTSIVYAMSIRENGYKDKEGNSLKDMYGLPSWDIINEAWGKI